LTEVYKLAVITSHVIQYQTPLFRQLASHEAVDLTVMFCSDHGFRNYYDTGFSTDIKWDTPLLDGFKYVFIRNMRHQSNVSTFLGTINPGIIARISKGMFDAVIIHGWANVTNLIAIGSAILTKTPLLFRTEATSLQRIARPKHRIISLILRQIFRSSAGLLYIGTINRDFYRGYGIPDNKMYFTPYSVDNTMFLHQSMSFQEDRRRVKEELGLSAADCIVLFSGKLIDRKRPLDLLQAVERLATECHLGLVYLGDGVLREAIESYCHSRRLANVRVVGFRNQTEVGRYFAAADVFVLPSEYETWGLVVNEAMCFGLPVVVTDRVGAGADLVRDGMNGYVVPVGDIEKLAAAIRSLASDPARRAQMGAVSRELVQDWNNDRCVAGILECLSNLGKRK
jgi:glycosyltransferase involved in cell wall biosynthesis